MGGLSDPVSALDEAMRSRRSTRAFLTDPVRRELIFAVLDVAGTAPSTFNTQPWMVHVLRGAPKERLSAALLRAHEESKGPGHVVIPETAPPHLVGRQREFFRRYYETLGIDATDAAARSRQTSHNYSFFGAPVGLIFTTDHSLTRHSWLDLGLYIQNVMLAAHVRGLATCPQVSFTKHEQVIRNVLGLENGVDVVCGMSMGYPNAEASVNHMGVEREGVERFSTWHGFEGAS